MGIAFQHRSEKILRRLPLASSRQAKATGRAIRWAILSFVIFGVFYTTSLSASAQAIPDLVARAEAGDVAAQYDLAVAYENGRGVARDLALAHKWYQAAARQNHAAANTRLGYLYQQSIGVDRDYERALAYYRAAAGLGDVLAHANLGWTYSNGLGVAQDFAEAAKWYRVAADQGLAWAQTNLASIYLNGQGVQRDDAEALKWVTKAAAQGSSLAMGFLGFMHEKGRGVRSDRLKAYICYFLAVERGADRYLSSLARMSLVPLTPLPPPELLVQFNAAKAGTEEFTKLAAQLKPNVLIEADPFLKEHKDLATRAVNRKDENDRLREASGWFERAIAATNSTAAMVQLGNLHLKQDWSLSWRDLRRDKSSANEFVGSAARAAELYKSAADKGSGVAMMTLAALYELGLGVPRDLIVAEAVYRKAIPVLGARAELGILRLSLENQWQDEIRRRNQLVLDQAGGNSPASGAEDEGVVIEAVDDFDLVVGDETGRQIFHGRLRWGEQYRPPREQAGLIFWPSFSNRSTYRVRIGKKVAKLPKVLKYNDGIRLDPRRLLEGNDLIVRGGDRGRYVRASTLSKARVVVKILAPSQLRYHNDDYSITYSETEKDGHLPIPDIDGLTLEIRPPADRGRGRGRAYVRLLVDGRNALELTVERYCVVNLALSPDKLSAARIMEGGQDCERMTELDAPVAHVVAADGEVIGKWQREPDESVPGVIADFVPGVVSGASLLAVGAGRWDEALQTQTKALKKLLRSDGPNSMETLDAELRLVDIELATGAYRQGVRRLDGVLHRLSKIGEIPAQHLFPFYETLASTLATTGRTEEAERLLFRAWSLRERANLEAGRAPYVRTENIVSSLVSNNSRSHEASIVYILRGLLLNEINYPDDDDGTYYEFGGGQLVELLSLFKETGRDADFKTFLPLAYQQAKFNAGLHNTPEPLQFPLKQFREQVFGGVDRSVLMADSLSHLARTYSWSGRHSEALPLYEQWEQTNRYVFGPASINVARSKAAIGQELFKLDRIGDALKTSREAFAIATSFVDTRIAASRKQSIAGIVKPATDALLEVLYAMRAQAPMEARRLTNESFEVGQRAQHSAAALALQNLGERLSRADPSLAVTEQKRQDLQEELARLDGRLVAAINRGDRGEEGETLRKIDLAERDLAELERQHPGDPAGRLEVIAPDEIMRLLDAGEALVSIVVADDATFIWVVTKTDARWVRLDLSTRALIESVAVLRCGLDATLWPDATDWPELTPGQLWKKAEQLARRRRCEALVRAKPTTELVGLLPVQVLPFDLKRAHELYKALLDQVGDLIRDKHLLIVPSGPLTSLPFNVLVTEPPPAGSSSKLADYAKVAWLGARTRLTVLPSVASLKTLRQFTKTSRATKPYLGVGNPLLEGPQDHPYWAVRYKEQAQLARDKQQCPKAVTQHVVSADGSPVTSFAKLFRGATADIEEVRQWAPLPETADELCEVGRRLGAPEGEILLGARATETTLKGLSEQGRLADYAILHFATHGALTGQVQGSAEPGLILTPPEKGTIEIKALERDDGFLTASEIATLKLDANWVVLSACNTAGGASESAEALSGIARAFFFAGARALLVSHWEVGSDAAVKLITRAFEALRAKPELGRAEAFRVSMRELIEGGSLADAHPSQWAPFIVVGEGGAQRQ